jgi:hypothetical protein
MLIESDLCEREEVKALRLQRRPGEHELISSDLLLLREAAVLMLGCVETREKLDVPKINGVEGSALGRKEWGFG